MLESTPMKIGTKSNLISAYAALFTVAAGIVLYDGWQRANPASNEAVAAQKAAAEKEASEKTPGHLAALR